VPASPSRSEAESPAPAPGEPNRFIRGVTAVTAAKVWFVIAGYAVYFGLTRLLEPREFGLYAVVTSIVSVVNNVLIAATLQAVSRFTARDEERAGAVLHAGYTVQVVLGLALLAAFELGAPLLAGLFRDPELVAPLRVVALVVPAYAVYAVNVGFLNGLRRFTQQATLDGTYSTLRATLQIGAVALGLGVIGAVAGFACAASVILGLSFLMVRRAPRPKGRFEARELIGFGGWLVALTLVANLALTSDLWIVKRLSDPAVANQQSGLYRAALSVSQLLYQLLIPLALVLFPNLSHLGPSPDPLRARALVRGALRYLAVTIVPGAALIAVMGREIVALLYPKSYGESGAWLQVLGPAYAAWTVAYLLAIAFAGAGRVRTGVLILSVGLLGQVAAGLLLCQRLGPRGAAYGDLVGMGLACAVGIALAVRRFGAIVPWASVARGAALALVLALVARAWPAAGFAVALKLAVLAAGSAILLFAGGELKRPRPRSG